MKLKTYIITYQAYNNQLSNKLQQPIMKKQMKDEFYTSNDKK